jgi:hypothetical protein
MPSELLNSRKTGLHAFYCQPGISGAPPDLRYCRHAHHAKRVDRYIPGQPYQPPC